MPAPTWSASSTGFVDIGGAWATPTVNYAAGVFHMLQVLQDGDTDGAVTITPSGIEDLAGTDSAMTKIPGNKPDGSWQVGPTTGVARLHIWVGRSLGGNLTISGGNSTSEDLFVIQHDFADVSAGTTLAEVIENSTAGNATNGVGNSSPVNDTSVVTVGADRLALNVIGMNDDPSGFATVFTGQSGGTWELRGSFGSSTGTDGAVVLQTAAMPSAGTINGGSYTIGAAAAWVVVGFALIGRGAVPRYGYVNYQDPGVF